MISKKLKSELKMKKDFERPEQEVIVSILRASDFIQYRLGQFFRQYGLTHPQYNILRILRGAGEPLPILEIANRLVSMVPGITGLIDKLEQRELVARHRCEQDRRVWYVSLTKKGMVLVNELDAPNAELDKHLAGHFTATECKQLVKLLDKARDLPGDHPIPNAP